MQDQLLDEARCILSSLKCIQKIGGVRKIALSAPGIEWEPPATFESDIIHVASEIISLRSKRRKVFKSQINHLLTFIAPARVKL